MHKRYHRILLPMLRLLLAMVSKSSRDQSVITGKVVNYLCHHRRAFEFLLSDDVSGVNVTVLQEMKYFTSLLYALAKAGPPKTGYPAGVSISNLFGFDTLVFSLLTRYKDPTAWKKRLVALSTKDQKDAQNIATNLDGEYTQLELRAWDDIVQMLCSALDLSLLASESPNSSNLPDQRGLVYPVDSTKVFRPRFTWLMALSAGDETNFSFGQRYPSLGSLAVVLAHSLKGSQVLLRERQRLSNFYQTPTLLTKEDLSKLQLSSELEGEGWVELTQSQRQLVAHNVISDHLQINQKRTLRTLHSTGLALYLMWRHLNYYLGSSDSTVGFVDPLTELAALTREEQTSTRDALAQLTRPPANQQHGLKMEALTLLQPVLVQLDQLDAMNEPINEIGAHHQLVFIQRALRKMKDLLYDQSLVS
ncbi:hypothetical protein IWQ62_003380 [Dispira parvispora]|uniref:Uncharacterized protein n=1 Tax=Dispira parvispora TaxID=1520584 RepID=A0A9W8ANK6_9FUNG|nr:hypothetical protein IWQ62_003380 [Dispira parvispora]